MDGLPTMGAHTVDSPCYDLHGWTVKLLLTSQQTGGQFSMIEVVIPAKSDGEFHIHQKEDESMYLLDGELEMTIGDDVFTLKAGESYFAPPNIKHRLRNVSDKPARGVTLTTPGGSDELIVQAGTPFVGGAKKHTPPSAEELLKMTAARGVTLLESAATS